MTVWVEPADDDAGPNRNWEVSFEYRKGGFSSGTNVKEHVSFHKMKRTAIAKAESYGLKRGDNQVIIRNENGSTETRYAREGGDDSDPDAESYKRHVGGSESKFARAKQVTETGPATRGEQGTWQVGMADMDALEHRRVIGNVPDRETAERVTDDLAKAEEFHQDRTGRARTVDEQKRAQVTTSYEAWAANPRRLDFPGVDTPAPAGSYRDEENRRGAAFDWSAPTRLGGGGTIDALANLEGGPSAGASSPSDGGGDYSDGGSVGLEDALYSDDDRLPLFDEANEMRGGNGGETADRSSASSVVDQPGLGGLEQQHVSDWDTDRLFEHRDRLFEGHKKARKARRARGGRRTDTSEDDMMRDYLSDISALEAELYDRGAMG